MRDYDLNVTLKPYLSNRKPKMSLEDPFMTLCIVAATARKVSSEMYNMA